MAETWPVGVPHRAKTASLRIPQPFRSPLVTNLEDGPKRSRRSTTKNIAQLAFAIEMPFAAFETFKAWVRGTLVDGTLPFDMQVWTGTQYAARRCSFTSPYQAEPLGTDHVTVSLALDVEDL